MNEVNTILFFIKVGILYSLLYLIYYIFFRNNTNVQNNRVYLLFIIPLSFLLPSINFGETAKYYEVILPVVEGLDISPPEKLPSQNMDWVSLCSGIYVLVSMLLFLKLLTDLFLLQKKIGKIRKGLITTSKPFSFFSFIHIPENVEMDNKKYIALHEQAHAKQWHSLDILIYRVTASLLWWTPFIWIGLRSVRCNHEFIADQITLKKSTKNNYSSILVAELLGVNCSVLANNFNYKPFIKKRIMMMKKQKSNPLSVLRYTAVIPVITIFILVSCSKQSAETNTSNTTYSDTTIYRVMETMPQFKGGMEELVKYLSNEIKYPQEAQDKKEAGTVYVNFLIDENGNIHDTKVLRGVSPSLDKEALRVVKTMPRWKPGEKDGVPVKASFNLPIKFTLTQEG